MSWKLKLMKMNWKFTLMIVFGIVLATVAFLKLPASQAQTDSESAVQENQSPVTRGKITEYPNGVSKIEPEAFGITGPVRDLPTSDPDAVAKSARYITKQKREEIRKQLLREKGVSEKEIQEDEINRLNAIRIKNVLPGAGAGEGPFQDPLVNRGRDSNAPQVMPTPGLTFDGATTADNAAQGIGGLLPPDTNGDVGPNHYVSSVNLVYKIFNKNGTVAAGPFTTSSLFNGLPAGDPCRVNNDGDPVVVYDSLADRWHISQFAVPGPDNFQCVALSVTGDPTGAYYVWRYTYPAQIFNDYPKVGVWSDAYHMTFNQFNNAGTAFLGLGILSQDRPKALAGDATTSVVYTNIALIDPGAGGALPADIDGIVGPPVGMAEVIAEFRADDFGDPLDAIRYYRWVPNFMTPASSTLTVLPDVALAAFDARQPAGRGDIEQSGGAALDSISDRMMHLFKYHNLGTQAAPVNSFVGNFSVNVSGVNPTSAALYQTGIRWFEMRRTGDVFSVFDQGTHNLTPGNGASGLNNWMGSIAQDNDGNLALGFSQSSTTQNADIRIAGRTVNTMNSGILNEGEALFFDALGSQTSTSNRWGDYSAMNVDPVDDCTFWYTQEYYATTSTAGWSTRVGSFIFPSCTPAEKSTINGTITVCSSGLPINLASVDATGGFNRVTGAPGTYSMTVSPGTYTVSAGKAGGFPTVSAPPVTVANGATATVNICLTGVAVLAPTTATLVSESCMPANGVIDPGETVTVAFGVQNTGAANTVNDIGTLQNIFGVTGAGAPQNYGVIVAGGPAVSRNFTFTADPMFPCGGNIGALIQHQDGATNLGSVGYTLPTGVTGAASTTSYTGPPVAVPDNVPAGANIVLPVSGVVGNISDLNFRLDALAGCDAVIGNTNASMDHTFNGDLQFKLTSPLGTTVNLITNRGGGGNNFCTVLLDDDGGFPAASTIPATGAVAGNFAPESPLSAFDGQNANGNWTLNVADVAGIDTGSLRRYSLIITGRACCGVVGTPVIAASSPTAISLENCGLPTPNGAIDPGETVTVDFPVINTGTGNTTNLVGTLQTTGGVSIVHNNPQTYGVVVAAGPSVTKSFRFTASSGATCGGTLTATIALQDGVINLGTVAYTFTLGTSTIATQTFSNATAIVIPAAGTGATTGAPATPYPSNIAVAGITAPVTKVTVALKQISHTFPSDVDVLLVGPTGVKFVLMSDVIGGTGLTGQTYTFDDGAATVLPSSGMPPASGSFRPTNYGTGDLFPAPAPAAPYLNPATAGTDTLAAFNGLNPNGTWSLYVTDDAGVDIGTFAGGWDLSITTTQFTCCGPTAASSSISGSVVLFDGSPLAGAVINLSGSQSRRTITDANGNYRFDNVETNGFYTVHPSRANFAFSPAERSFNQLGNNTEATFTAAPIGGALTNPLDTPEYFVRQHYLDFLNREPDEGGFNFWSNQMLECGSDAGCLEVRRINVSAAYFLSIEFQETGGLVDGLYRASYNRRPLFDEFMPDTATVARDVIVGRSGWPQQLEANKQAFVNAWVQRPAFRAAYGDLPNDAYVDALIAHTGVSFSQGERDALVNGLNAGASTRADVLRQIAENERFVNAKRNATFVMMEYFGYLRRDPDESGYQFWLNKLNQFDGNFERAEMVKAFLVSGEYRQRFPR